MPCRFFPFLGLALKDHLQREQLLLEFRVSNARLSLLSRSFMDLLRFGLIGALAQKHVKQSQAYGLAGGILPETMLSCMRTLTSRTRPWIQHGACSFSRGATSQFNGVHWHKASQKFAAHVYIAGATHYLGLFHSEQEAAQRYDKQLRALCQDEHRLRRSLNFPTPSEASFRQSPQEARQRALQVHSDTTQLEEASLHRVQQRFLSTPQASIYEIARVSRSSRIDALIQTIASQAGGACLQFKSASARKFHGNGYGFKHTKGYEGMLLVLVALDRDLLWAVPGKLVTSQTLWLTIDSARDRAWRVHDIGFTLESCFLNPQEFPQVSLAEARLQCSNSNRVEERAHALMAILFALAKFELQRSFTSASVDSMLVGNGLALRAQEKASNLCKNGHYAINLWKRGGVLGRLPYEATDFDVLLAALLDAGRLTGLFLFPISVLMQRGYVGHNAIRLLLLPPWKPAKLETTGIRYSWQMEYFVDLRDWTGGAVLPDAVRSRLDHLLSQLAVAQKPKNTNQHRGPCPLNGMIALCCLLPDHLCRAGSMLDCYLLQR